MRRCPICHSANIVRHCKKREGLPHLSAAMVLVIDLLAGALSISLYATLSVLCMYDFFSNGLFFHTGSDCLSEFQD